MWSLHAESVCASLHFITTFITIIAKTKYLPQLIIINILNLSIKLTCLHKKGLQAGPKSISRASCKNSLLGTITSGRNEQQEIEEEGKTPIYSGHCILPTMPKGSGSTHTSLAPNVVFVWWGLRGWDKIPSCISSILMAPLSDWLSNRNIKKVKRL